VPDRQVALWAFERADADTPFEAIVAEQDRQMVAEVLDRLPAPTQRLLRQFYWDELGRNEIAKSLGIPASTVGSRLCYVRKQLRARIHCLR
jgi:RNA polymerase sigma factor (sigma-70 family)